MSGIDNMIMKCTDLQPDDKLKFTKEMINWAKYTEGYLSRAIRMFADTICVVHSIKKLDPPWAIQITFHKPYPGGFQFWDLKPDWSWDGVQTFEIVELADDNEVE